MRLGIALLMAASLAIIGCDRGPAPGEAFEKPVPNSGTAQGRLKTDEGAEMGIAGGGGNATPGAETPPGQ